MKTYPVPMCRIGYGHKIICVTAESQEEANNKALNEAGDHTYTEHSSDYVLQDEPSIGIMAMRLLKDLHLLINKDKNNSFFICEENSVLIKTIGIFIEENK